MSYEDQRPQSYPGGYFQPQTTGHEATQYSPQYGQPQYAQQPYPGAPQQPYYPPQPPVVVNVVQNAGAGPRRSVSKQRKGTSHGLHLVLTICTGGVWGVCVWLPLTAWHKFGPREKTVTRYR